MLEVVEHEQRGLASEHGGDLRDGRRVGIQLENQRNLFGKLLATDSTGSHRRKVDEKDAIRKSVLLRPPGDKGVASFSRQ